MQEANAPIVFRTESAKDLYTSEGSAHAVASSLPEICIVTEGSGIHQLLDQAIPCREGDAYVVSQGLPHVFLRTGEEPLTVCRILFDPTVFFDADGRFWMVYGSWSGGIFLLVYLLIVILVGLPGFLIELTLGRTSGLSPIKGMEGNKEFLAWLR